jgi:putative transposase
MIDRRHDLSISKQAEALNISRVSVYYLPRLVPKTELAIMHGGKLNLTLWPFRGRGIADANPCHSTTVSGPVPSGPQKPSYAPRRPRL